jgi:hypothetical protein
MLRVLVVITRASRGKGGEDSDNISIFGDSSFRGVSGEGWMQHCLGLGKLRCLV